MPTDFLVVDIKALLFDSDHAEYFGIQLVVEKLALLKNLVINKN